jgi:bifunctional DNase/RNase
MKKIKLEILGLSDSQTHTGAYALVLGEQDAKRRLPIIIGAFEAQSIVFILEKMQPSRPMTHDLFKNMADSFHIEVEEVIIYELKEGVFYSKLVCNDGLKKVEIDSRTSDAVALAIRFGCPIYTYEFILSTAGLVFNDEDKEPDTSTKDIASPLNQAHYSTKGYESYTTEELEKELKQAIEDESYEKASKIRDELAKRKNG